MGFQISRGVLANAQEVVYNTLLMKHVASLLDVSTLLFYRASGSTLVLSELIEEVKRFINEDPKRHYRVLIGTDSELHEEAADFVTAVVVHRVGVGGRYFFRRFEEENGISPMSLYQRVWHEVLASLRLAQEVVMLLADLQGKFHFEVHIDVGTNGETRGIIQEVTSVVRSYGFSVKTKPESFAATKVADRHL